MILLLFITKENMRKCWPGTLNSKRIGGVFRRGSWMKSLSWQFTSRRGRSVPGPQKIEVRADKEARPYQNHQKDADHQHIGRPAFQRRNAYTGKRDRWPGLDDMPIGKNSQAPVCSYNFFLSAVDGLAEGRTQLACRLKALRWIFCQRLEHNGSDGPRDI